MLSLVEEVSAWELWQTQQLGLAPRHAKQTSLWARRWVEFAGDELTPGSCVAWLAGMTRGHQLAPHTVRNRMSACRQFAGWLVVQGRLENNPWLHIPAPRGRSGVGADTLTQQQVEDLIEVVDRARRFGDGRSRKSAEARCTFYRLLVATGMRRGEWGLQEWVDIDLDNASLVVTKDKSRRRDSIPLSAAAVKILQKWREFSTDRLVFPSMPTFKALNRDLKEAGISGRGKFHRFRVGFITNAFDIGVEPRFIQQLVRHKSIDQTHRYLRHKSEDLKSATEKISTIGKDFSRSPLDRTKSVRSTARMLKPSHQDEQHSTPHAGTGLQQFSLRDGLGAVRSGVHGRGTDPSPTTKTALLSQGRLDQSRGNRI
ncbi:MAG: tyrosine-type recombinase/integrase [Planctomycetes bacterium]|nr:tyrosine-type recombinase/integrase [Planctomycetota bacterium]